MYKVILAATDGSGSGMRAMQSAVDIASRTGARLVMLSVVQSGPLPAELSDYASKDLASSPHPLLANIPSWFDRARDVVSRHPGEVHAMAEDLSRAALDQGTTMARGADVAQYESVIEHGDPAEKIVDVAERENADLIVFGRRGLGKSNKLYLGSIAYKLLQMTDRSCLTVK